MAGLLDFLQTPQGAGLLSGVASYAMNARRGTPVNNLGRGAAGALIGYQEAANTQKLEREKAAKITAMRAALGAGFNPATAPTQAQYGLGGFQGGAGDIGMVAQQNRDINSLMRQAPAKQVAGDASTETYAFNPGESVYGTRLPAMGDYNTQPPAYENSMAEILNRRSMGENAQMEPPLFPPQAAQTFPVNKPQEELPEQAMMTSQGAPGSNETFDPRKAAMAMLQSGDPELMNTGFKMLSEPQKMADYTAEIKNWQYAQSLPEDQRGAFLGIQKAGSVPSKIQEWEYFNKLPPQEQAAYLEMIRAPQMMNLGGTMAVRSPMGGIVEQYQVTPKPQDMPEFQAAQASAVEGAKTTAKTQSEAASNLPKVQASAANARKMVEGLLSHPGFSSSVGATYLPGFKYIPGSKEADFNNRLEQLQGAAFLEAFNTLKGGGQITEVEGKKATQAINRMSTSISEDEFRAAAKDFLDVVGRAERNAKSAATPNEQDYIMRRRQEGASDRQIADELNATSNQQQRATGTYKDPFTVNSDSDYNSVPRGKYYKAPDGSIRQRK